MMQSPSVSRQRTRDLGPAASSSTVPVPDRISFRVAEHERISTLHDFSRQDEVGLALLNFRAGEDDFVSLSEANTHVSKKRLRAQIYVDRVGALLREQVGNFGLTTLRRRFQLLYCRCHLGLGMGIVLGRTCRVGGILLPAYGVDGKDHDKHDQDKNPAKNSWKAYPGHGSSFLTGNR